MLCPESHRVLQEMLDASYSKKALEKKSGNSSILSYRDIFSGTILKNSFQ